METILIPGIVLLGENSVENRSGMFTEKEKFVLKQVLPWKFNAVRVSNATKGGKYGGFRFFHRKKCNQTHPE